MLLTQSPVGLVHVVARVQVVCNFWNVRVWNIYADVTVVLVANLLPIAIVAHECQSFQGIAPSEKRDDITVFGRTSVFPGLVTDEIAYSADVWSDVEHD